VSAGEAQVDEPLVRRVLGIPDREAYFGIAGAILGHDAQTTLQQLHAAFEKGMDPRELAEGLSEHFRNVLVLKVDPERGHDLVAASNEDLARLTKQGEGWADTDLLRLMRLAAEAQWPMRDSPQPLVHLEAAVLQMATLEPAESVAALIARLEALEKRLAGGGTAAAGGATPRAPATAGTRTHGFAAPGPVALPAPARVTAPAAPPARVTPAAVPSSFTPRRAAGPSPRCAARRRPRARRRSRPRPPARRPRSPRT